MKVNVKFAPWSPWSEVVIVGNISTLGGIAKDVYDSMAGQLNLQFDIKLQNDLMFGSLNSDGKWTGMLGTMQRNETDISGPYFVNEQRSTLVDFSVPVGFSQLSIVSGLVPANRDSLLIFRIFTVQVWILIILSTLVAAATASFIYMVFPSSAKRAKIQVFLKYTWMFYGTLLGKECGSSNRWFLRPVLPAASFRLFQCLWLMGPALVIMYTYQGAITSTFAADKLKPLIETIEELKDNTVVKPSTFRYSFPFACFQRLEGTRLSSLYTRVLDNLKTPPTNEVSGWFDGVANGKEAFVAETVYMKSMVGDRFRESGKCGIRVTPTDFCTAYISFAFRGRYRPDIQQKFNKMLLRFNEASLYQRRMLASVTHYDICTQSAARTSQALNLSDLVGAFLIYAVGIFTSIITLILERMVKWQKAS